MPTLRATRSTLPTIAGLASIFFSSRPTFAAASLSTPDCAVSGPTLNCHLHNFLDFLYTAAGLLSLILLVVILIATRIYSRNKSSSKGGK